MGCTQSKIENEEIVNRCKERKTVMKESVSARNAFAAAHFSYATALKNTGAALSDYAEGEVEFPDHHHPSSVDVVSSSASMILPPAPPQPPYESLRPPPPPLLQRAATMPEFSVSEPDFKSHPSPIMEEVDEDDEIEDRSLKHRSSSRNSGGGGGRSGISKREMEKEDLPPPSPSQPAPRQSESNLHRAAPPPPPPHGMSSWDYFFPSMENVPGPSLAEVDDESSRLEREEIQREMLEEVEEHNSMNHPDIDDGGEGRSADSGDNEAEDVAAEVVEEPPPPPPETVKVRIPATASAEGRRSSGKTGAQNLNLLQIFTELDDCFLKASESAHEVSKMLEANRLHYHSNFADKRGM